MFKELSLGPQYVARAAFSVEVTLGSDHPPLYLVDDQPSQVPDPLVCWGT